MTAHQRAKGPAPMSFSRKQETAPPTPTASPVVRAALAVEESEETPYLAEVEQEQDRARELRLQGTARSVFNAVDGWGTARDDLFTALRELPAEDLATFSATYEQDYGEPLDAALKGDLSGADLLEAEALMTGDVVSATLLGLDNALGVNDDEDTIKAIMEGLTPEQLATVKASPGWAAVEERVSDQLGGFDLESFAALSEGDHQAAAAVQLDRAMGTSLSWYDPRHLGTGEAAINEVFQGATPEETLAISQAFDARMAGKGVDATLNQALDSELGGTDRVLTEAVMQGDESLVRAAKVEQAMEGIGTRKSDVYAQIENLTPEQREAFAATYRDAFGVSLDTRLEQDLSGLDLTRAQMAMSGEENDAFKVYYAIKGLGTRDDDLAATISGSSAAEIAAMERDWSERYQGDYGMDFRDALMADLSGRAEFDTVEVGLRGKPESVEEMRDVAALVYDYERGSRSTLVGWGVMGTANLLGLSTTNAVVDHQYASLQSAEDANVASRFGVFETGIEDYRSDKDAAGEAVAVAAEVTAATIATIVTEGAASPWLVAALSTGAGIGARAAVQGEAYGMEAMTGDAVRGMLAAGVVRATSAEMVTDRLNEIAKVFGPEFAAQVADPNAFSIAKSAYTMGTSKAVDGAAQGALKGALDDEALDNGVAEYLKGIGTESALGGARGAAIGTVSGTASGMWQSMRRPPPAVTSQVESLAEQGLTLEPSEDSKTLPLGAESDNVYPLYSGETGEQVGLIRGDAEIFRFEPRDVATPMTPHESPYFDTITTHTGAQQGSDLALFIADSPEAVADLELLRREQGYFSDPDIVMRSTTYDEVMAAHPDARVLTDYKMEFGRGIEGARVISVNSENAVDKAIRYTDHDMTQMDSLIENLPASQTARVEDNWLIPALNEMVSGDHSVIQPGTASLEGVEDFVNMVDDLEMYVDDDGAAHILKSQIPTGEGSTTGGTD